MIGYYIHHHGRGHLMRATSISAALDQPVVGLSSLPSPAGTSPYRDWVQLARDDAADSVADPTAGGVLHWAPRDDAGLRERMAAIAAWVDRFHPAAVVVDVSIEVAALLRLLGVPVIIVAMPGDREDPAHQLAYRLADAVLAFWTREVYDPSWLTAHHDRTHFVGALSRFDDRARPGCEPTRRRTAVLLGGAGGSAISTADRAGLPLDWEWQHLGGQSAGSETAAPWIEDPWPALCAADIVVTHAGQNALADVAAAGRPAIVVPQPRPHEEQRRAAEAIGAAGIAHAVPSWPCASQWPAVLDQARDLGGQGWARWRHGDAASRAAAVIDAVSTTGAITSRSTR